jgi:hypothetical protein
MCMRNELAFILHAMSKIYRSPCIARPSLGQVDITSLLSLAIRNDVGYYITKVLSTIYANKLDKNTRLMVKNIARKGDNKFKNIQYVLQTLSYHLNDYLLIKTYRKYPRIGNDVDILVHDFDKAARELMDAKINLVEYTSNQQRAVFIQKGVKIHLHGNISWAKENLTFLDDDLIWYKPRHVKVDRTQTKIPNLDADFLIYLAHLNYENLHITLSDLLYIYELATRVNWDIVLKQASKHHWEKTLGRSVWLLDTIHHTIYPSPCPFMKWNLRHRGYGDLGSVSLPKPFPRTCIILAFIEKKSITWVLRNKILKSMYILASHDTYRPFYVPPERGLIVGREV